MGLKYFHFYQTKKHQFSFKEINELLQLSEAYTRQVVSDMVKKNF